MRRGWLLLLLLLAGCSRAVSITSTPAPSTPVVYALHQVAGVPGWQITVSGDYLTGAASGSYVLAVDLALVNTSAHTAKLPAFTLTANGEQETPAMFASQTPLPAQIAGGAAVEGQLAWSVPITIKQGILAYQSLAIWKLTP